MKSLIALFLFVTISHFTLSQNTHSRENRENRQNKVNPAPGNCLIEAKILKIKRKDNRNCETKRCIARIEILKVKGYGSAFPVKLVPEQRLKVRFTPSLNKTSELPGLKKKDTFEGTLRSKPVFNSNQTEFIITHYTKTSTH
jgi:hypothetical protein